jgi:hypothetical protein
MGKVFFRYVDNSAGLGVCSCRCMIWARNIRPFTAEDRVWFHYVRSFRWMKWHMNIILPTIASVPSNCTSTGTAYLVANHPRLAHVAVSDDTLLPSHLQWQRIVWLCVLRRRPRTARWLGFWVGIPPEAWLFFSFYSWVVCSPLRRPDPSSRGVLQSLYVTLGLIRCYIKPPIRYKKFGWRQKYSIEDCTFGT